MVRIDLGNSKGFIQGPHTGGRGLNPWPCSTAFLRPALQSCTASTKAGTRTCACMDSSVTGAGFTRTATRPVHGVAGCDNWLQLLISAPWEAVGTRMTLTAPSFSLHGHVNVWGSEQGTLVLSVLCAILRLNLKNNINI